MGSDYGLIEVFLELTADQALGFRSRAQARWYLLGRRREYLQRQNVGSKEPLVRWLSFQYSLHSIFDSGPLHHCILTFFVWAVGLFGSDMLLIFNMVCVFSAGQFLSVRGYLTTTWYSWFCPLSGVTRSACAITLVHAVRSRIERRSWMKMNLTVYFPWKNFWQWQIFLFVESDGVEEGCGKKHREFLCVTSQSNNKKHSQRT